VHETAITKWFVSSYFAPGWRRYGRLKDWTRTYFAAFIPPDATVRDGRKYSVPVES
jgi:hypothetical protein